MELKADVEEDPTTSDELGEIVELPRLDGNLFDSADSGSEFVYYDPVDPWAYPDTCGFISDQTWDPNSFEAEASNSPTSRIWKDVNEITGGYSISP
ncbi:uncharacterized protein A4U43_C01F17260 [Asparagus officinalis]|uniref:Uncharacterized protein n=1 Tax=Asparagus officinalis TaxID=4686 RepID=A0A5P1FUQ8_ASPOF|nr:uncharacterized protein A4U43_C01F17260 [Asparagus officinalis]